VNVAAAVARLSQGIECRGIAASQIPRHVRGDAPDCVMSTLGSWP
jgi:hypothetical protein